MSMDDNVYIYGSKIFCLIKGLCLGDLSRSPTNFIDLFGKS